MNSADIIIKYLFGTFSCTPPSTPPTPPSIIIIIIIIYVLGNCL